jgi:hypothetical protein
MKYFILCLIIFSFWACQNATQKNEVVVTAIIDTIPKKILPKKDTTNTIHWDSLINNELNLSKPILIDSNWLIKAQKYKNDTLPEELAHYFSRLFCDNNKKIQYTNLTANLDEDADNEQVLFFFTRCETAMMHRTLILDKKQNQWFIVASISSSSRGDFQEMKPEIVEKEKILVCKSSYWGFALGGTNFHFYKYLNSKYQSVLGLPVSSYKQTLHNRLFCSVKGDYTFKNSSLIKINYYVDIGSLENEKNNVFKNREINLDLIWNAQTQKFEVNNSKLDITLETFAFFTNFETLFKNELTYLSQYGTPAQKEALKYYKSEMEEENRIKKETGE